MIDSYPPNPSDRENPEGYYTGCSEQRGVILPPGVGKAMQFTCPTALLIASSAAQRDLIAVSFLRSNICYFHTLSDTSDTCKAAQVFAYTCMLRVNVHKVTVFPYLGDLYLYYVAFSPHQSLENTLLLLPSPPFPFPIFFFFPLVLGNSIME